MTEMYPTTMVIFGATGDLFRKKLSVALLSLLEGGRLPAFNIVAFSRRPWDNAQFRAFVKESLGGKLEAFSPDTVDSFLSRVFYIQGDLDSVQSYHDVATLLSSLDGSAGVCMNKLLYLATPPSFYERILKHISVSGLSIPCAPTKDLSDTGWTRILIEKPFGSDATNAARLDRMLGKLFSENQIFRIDHYLAKETLQNILTFRFANGIFEPVWNRRFVEKVEISLFEKEGINGRGSFYDPLGALRDVGQNHALQMLALVAMDNPGVLDAGAIRKQRAAVLKKTKILGGKPSDTMARAQYDGYHAETGVAAGSQTETYFKVVLAVGTSRWRGVPFILESGKGLPESKAEITVHFKKPEGCFCADGTVCGHRNAVTFKIQPQEAISVLFWSKRPGFGFDVIPTEFSVSTPHAAGNLDAYARVLADAFRGDQTLFTSTDEVAAQWKVTAAITKRWQKISLGRYEKGTMPHISF